MPRVPRPILEMARSHHEQMIRLEGSARRRVRRELDRALRRIEEDRRFRSFSDFEALQASEIEILARLSARETQGGLEEALEDIIDEGLLLAPSHADRELQAWTEYYGAEARPLRLAAIAELSRETLIERIPRSLRRWGPDIARRVRRELSVAATTRAFGGNVVDSLERIIGAERWKADRIFRTELFNAYNTAHLESMETARDVYGVQTKKSAIVTFDARTDPDSYPVHGQVRELDENFIDGDGRRYLHPPGRPNDREKEIPWINDGEDLGLISSEEGMRRAQAARSRQRAIAGRARQPAPLDVNTFEGRRQRAVLAWQAGSHSRRSVAVKEAARREFSLDGETWNPRGREFYSAAEMGELREDVRRMYTDTQTDFIRKRRHSVRLYRGVKTDTAVEGLVESWTSDPGVAKRHAGATGEVLVADIDRRRILSSVESPGWVVGPHGDQLEYIVLADPPALNFEPGDWTSGPFRARDLDSDAVTAGPWGILEDSSGRARLEHTVAGRTLLEGEEFAKSDLREAAQYLDRSGYFDANGQITRAGVRELPDAIDALRVRYAEAIPDGEDGGQAIGLLGDRWGVINDDIDPGSPTTWSRRTIKVTVEGSDGYEFREMRGVVQRNWAIVTDKGGPGDGYFSLVHLPTGKVLFEGGRTFYQKGFRVPFDVGGWKQRNLKEVADRLHDYVDPETGAILESKREDFEKIIAELRETHALYDDSEVDQIFENALAEGVADDPEDDPFLAAMARRVAPKSGPRKGAASAARKSHVAPKPELSPEERFEEAVQSRMRALRRGQYNRFKDPEFDKAVQIEAKRRRAEGERKRLKETAESYSAFQRVDLDEGRAFVEQARRETLERKAERDALADDIEDKLEELDDKAKPASVTDLQDDAGPEEAARAQREAAEQVMRDAENIPF